MSKYLSFASLKNVQATREVSSPQKTSSNNSKQYISSSFLQYMRKEVSPASLVKKNIFKTQIGHL